MLQRIWKNFTRLTVERKTFWVIMIQYLTMVRIHLFFHHVPLSCLAHPLKAEPKKKKNTYFFAFFRSVLLVDFCKKKEFFTKLQLSTIHRF